MGVDGVDCCLDQLFLKVTELLDIVLSLLDLDRWISADDTETSAGCIQKNTIILLEDLGDLPSVIVGNNSVGSA